MNFSDSLLLIVAALCIASQSVLAIGLDTFTEDGLSFGYYHAKCPQFEGIVHNKVKEWTNKDSTLGPSLMRLHFHDCAVRVSRVNGKSSSCESNTSSSSPTLLNNGDFAGM